MEFLTQNLDALLSIFPQDAMTQGVLVLAVSFLAGSGVFAFRRRQGKNLQPTEKYFQSKELLSPPNERPAYSDRMAYVLAEMSELAYYQFEGSSSAVDEAANKLEILLKEGGLDVKEFLETFSLDLLGTSKLSIKFLEGLLEKSQFKLLYPIINIGDTQGFACKYTGSANNPYIVIAFRGTEAKINDWLTDADAKPKELGEGLGKVHKGFYNAFNEKTDANDQTVSQILQQLMSSPEAQNEEGQSLPLFFTGHSLGGALALLATQQLAKNINGACYTFGGPRIGNYEFFEKRKTPVYRVVNSSDIVPRVPPGAGLVVARKLIELCSWLTGALPPVSRGFDKLEAWIDRLSGYRHVGDLRYLTDVATGKFETVKLLSNPPAIDRLLWMWQHLASSFMFPIRSHKMAIYRKKLLFIANARKT